MARRRQKGKHKKRKRSWHRGRVEHYKWTRATKRWPDIATQETR